MTFDLVTDWINWKQWSEVGGYNWHHLVYIIQIAFLCVASVGTALWTIETITIILKLFDIHRMVNKEVENPSDKVKEFPERNDAEGQEERFNGTEESSEQLRDVVEQGNIFEETEEKSSEELGEDTEEQHIQFDKSEQTQEKPRTDEGEEEINLDETGDPLEKPYNDSAEEALEKFSEKSRDCGDVKKIVETEKPHENVENDSEELEKNIEGMSNNPERKKDDNIVYDNKLVETRIKRDEWEKEESREEKSIDRRQKYVYRSAIVILMLTGLLEDLPVVIVTFYTAASPSCGFPARQEVGSVLTMVTILSAMLNSLWTMIILFCELCDCQKCWCQREKDTYSKKSFKNLPQKTCRQRPMNLGPSKYCRKRWVVVLGKILLFGFIFLLFSGNFIMGMLTLGHITGSISMSPIGVKSILYLRHFVTADRLGPGLDGRRDEAMFIYLEMKLPQQYQVVLRDHKSDILSKSAWTNRIFNRLYIGQFEELSHLKDGTLTKAIPCSRVFPFMDKVDEKLFLWKDSMRSFDTDLSACKLIFTLGYFPNETDWNNPFANIFHGLYECITVEWGILVNNESICPSGLRPLSINEVLTNEVENDIISYPPS